MVLLTKASQCAFALNRRVLGRSVNSRSEPCLIKVVRQQAVRYFIAPLPTGQPVFNPHIIVGTSGHFDYDKASVSSANSKVLAPKKVAKFREYTSTDSASKQKLQSSASNYYKDHETDIQHGHIGCPGHASNIWWWRRRPGIESDFVVPTMDGALPRTHEHLRLAVQLHELLRQFDPAIMPVVPIEAPSAYPIIEKRAMRRMLRVRRRKMKKHKRRKRYRRDFYKYATFHREKKARAEKAFRYKMTDLLRELDTYDAEKYVRETIARAKVDPHEGLAWSGRKKHAHWSELMTIEELYGLPKSDFIDKSAGYPDEEDASEIARLKADYYRRFRGIEIKLGGDPEKSSK